MNGNPFNHGFAEGQATLPVSEWQHFGSFAGTAPSNAAFGDFAAGLRWIYDPYIGLEAYGRGFAEVER